MPEADMPHGEQHEDCGGADSQTDFQAGGAVSPQDGVRSGQDVDGAEQAVAAFGLSWPAIDRYVPTGEHEVSQDDLGWCG